MALVDLPVVIPVCNAASSIGDVVVTAITRGKPNDFLKALLQ